MMVIGLIILAIVVVLILVWVGIYNKLVRYRNELENSESQIDVQLMRRADLIPNLVNTVKGYAKHESETFEKVVQLRSQIMNPDLSLNDRLKANDLLDRQLQGLKVTVEAYPDLKANQNFLRLQEELTNTENKVSYARQNYNDTAAVYNTSIQTFPNSIVAGSKFKKADFLAAPQEKREVPEVQF